MENLKKSFSDKFLEKVKELGDVLPVNDEMFFIVFKPENGRAALVHYKKKDQITVDELCVNEYQPLVMHHTLNGLKEDGNEGHAIWSLKQIRDK